jgi:hypothetical protein
MQIRNNSGAYGKKSVKNTQPLDERPLLWGMVFFCDCRTVDHKRKKLMPDAAFFLAKHSKFFERNQ